MSFEEENIPEKESIEKLEKGYKVNTEALSVGSHQDSALQSIWLGHLG